MAALNKVICIGNLGKNPEVRMTPSGAKVASFSIAITEKFKDKNGQQKETTEWLNVVLWRRQAEIAEQYLKKGSSIYLEGKLQTQSWDDPHGQKRYKTEIVGSHFQMLGGGKGGSSETNSSENTNTSNSQGYGGPSETPPPYEDNMPF